MRLLRRRAFRRKTRAMAHEARRISRRMRAQARSIDPAFAAFLVDKGPDAVIGFASLSEVAQRRMQVAWEQAS